MGEYGCQENRKGSAMKPGPDMTVRCGDGFISLRVGAVIMKEGRFLMVRNDVQDYFYSVGGRIRFGETAEEAVIREVFEETGVRMEVDRLGFVHENYFIGDSRSNLGKLVYETAYYFYMKVPESFEPVCRSVSGDGAEEYLQWIRTDEPRTIFPDFFRTELQHPSPHVKVFLDDGRPRLISED